MAAYIMSGQMSKMLMSPKIGIYPEEWLTFDKEADLLQKRLEILRKMNYDTCKPHPYLSEIRDLRKQLSKIDSKMHKILMKANPEYNTFWFN